MTCPRPARSVGAPNGRQGAGDSSVNNNRHSSPIEPGFTLPEKHDPAEIADCWKTTGVEGDGSCPDLEKIIHCRNCAVYSGAGLRLLDRPLPADYRRERTEHYAGRRKIAGGRVSAVIFRIGTEWLGLSTTVFQEVAECRSVHSIPHRRSGGTLGLANVRGELILCVSIGWLLGLTAESRLPARHPAGKRLLVGAWEGKRLAFPADEVFGVLRFHREEVNEPPGTLRDATLTFTQGILPWEKKTVALLNAETLFSTFNRNLS